MQDGCLDEELPAGRRAVSCLGVLGVQRTARKPGGQCDQGSGRKD